MREKAYNLGATGATEEITLFYPRMMFRTHTGAPNGKFLEKDLKTTTKRE